MAIVAKNKKKSLDPTRICKSLCDWLHFSSCTILHKTVTFDPRKLENPRFLLLVWNIKLKQVLPVSRRVMNTGAKNVRSVADPETSERGPRNMKYKPLHSAAIFFAYFSKLGGGMVPLGPPGSATADIGTLRTNLDSSVRWRHNKQLSISQENPAFCPSILALSMGSAPSWKRLKFHTI